LIFWISMMRPHLGLSRNKYSNTRLSGSTTKDYDRATDAHFRPDKPWGATGKSLIVLNPWLTLNHRVPGSSPGAPTIQSLQTARFRYDAKWGVFRGFSGHSLPGFWSLWAFAHFGGEPGALSLHPKIPFPAAGIEPEVRPQLPTRNSDFWGHRNLGFWAGAEAIPEILRIRLAR
jgi:hypothetical protein